MAKQKSRAVKNSVVVGTPAAIVGGALGAYVANKYGIPPELTGAVLSMFASGTASLIAHLTAKKEAAK
jgi:ABC-type uncharacterized transport system permease subunit